MRVACLLLQHSDFWIQLGRKFPVSECPRRSLLSKRLSQVLVLMSIQVVTANRVCQLPASEQAVRIDSLCSIYLSMLISWPDRSGGLN